MARRLLIADDDPVTRQMLVLLAEKWGFEISTACDGNEAWTQLHSEPPPQIILLDWMMPGMHGPEICKKLRTENRVEYQYVIMLTGRTSREDLIEALESGADDFINKPVNTTELRMRIRAGERVIAANEQLQDVNRNLDSLVAERTNQLKQALSEAQQATAAKASFLANMSHEIRTPLNGIASFVELLLYSELPKKARDDLFTIKNCVYSLKSIIDSVLDLSKLESDKVILESTQFSIRDVLNDVMKILRVKFSEREIEHEIYVADQIPDQVIGDPIRFQQIVTNLLGNAAKFCLQQGAVLVYANPHSEAEDSLCVHLAVADTGIGIPEEKRKLIFQSFSQADSSTTRHYGGTGLGLAITKGLVDLMNGRIWFNSTPGVGSTFHVTLPFGRVAAADSKPEVKVQPTYEPALQSTIHPAIPRGKGTRLLLAEDNDVNQEVMAEILRHQGYEVETASNGIEALRKIELSKFDLILMDIQMPEMDGEEATRRIRECQGRATSIPIVALTGDAVVGSSERYRQLGMDGCITKPVRFDELFDVIDSLVKR